MINSDKGSSLLEITSRNGKLNNEIENALNMVSNGNHNYITVERRIVLVNGKEKRIPSLLYSIK